MATKNVRNTSAMTTLNFNAQAGATGPTGAVGPQGSPGSLAYSIQNNISMQLDPTSSIFSNPLSTSISCEKIGNMIFIKLNFTNVDSPVGSGQIVSTTGCIPVAFRPTSDRITTCLVVNGFVDSLPILQRSEPWNVFLGVCKLSTNGTLSFAPDRSPAFGPFAIDGLTLANFQGPRPCGVLAQTLCFRAD